MARQARLDAPGTLHHIIIRGIEKKKIVDDHQDRERLISRLGTLSSETKTSIYARSVMDNHAHILVKSGPKGIAQLMRRLLTGYAITYNNRHKRHGHLFQNRYKSIVCDEDTYFAELVRYIHLNPLRAGLVKTLSELDRYAYCGHSVIMGKREHQWQDRNYVLNWFGNKERDAMKAYRHFVRGGIEEGKRPDLVGGGLIRSLGGWSEVLSMRRRKERRLTDERIPGSGEFVQGILNEAEEDDKPMLSAKERQGRIKEAIEKESQSMGIDEKELKAGGCRAVVAEARANITRKLVGEYGLTLAEVARNVGVSTTAISKIMSRGRKLN